MRRVGKSLWEERLPSFTSVGISGKEPLNQAKLESFRNVALEKVYPLSPPP